MPARAWKRRPSRTRFSRRGTISTIIPVINKIDLPAAQPDFVKEQIENVLAIPADDALPISAKSGLGVEEVLEAIVERVPPPKGRPRRRLRALIFDSWFDSIAARGAGARDGRAASRRT